MPYIMIPWKVFVSVSCRSTVPPGCWEALWQRVWWILLKPTPVAAALRSMPPLSSPVNNTGNYDYPSAWSSRNGLLTTRPLRYRYNAKTSRRIDKLTAYSSQLQAYRDLSFYRSSWITIPRPWRNRFTSKPWRFDGSSVIFSLTGQQITRTPRHCHT